MQVSYFQSIPILTHGSHVYTLYFENFQKRVLIKPLIGLIPKQKKHIINNIFYHTSLETSCSKQAKSFSLLFTESINQLNLYQNKLLRLKRVKWELKEPLLTSILCNFTLNPMHFSYVSIS